MLASLLPSLRGVRTVAPSVAKGRHHLRYAKHRSTSVGVARLCSELDYVFSDLASDLAV